jgi:hypothetical protein
MFTAEEKYGQTDRVPEPAISAPGSIHHPKTYPARRPPVVEPAHHTMIATADEFQHCLREYRHAVTPRVSDAASGKSSR